MKESILAAVLFALPATVAAQNTGIAFQSALTGADALRTRILGAQNGKPVAGHPLTADEERHTLQILADGTRIETKTVDKFYRDDQGRTRTERADGVVVIHDVVAGRNAQITKGRKMTVQQDPGVSIEAKQKMEAEMEAVVLDLAEKARAIRAQMPATASRAAPAPTPAPTIADKLNAEAAAKNAEHLNEESLGAQQVNGVRAEGTRTVTTIPIGQIGNDRPIQIVNERWYSNELQMLVKSTNKDPRFGETTYELTNIIQSLPDPALFQVPARSPQQ
jgi:hypothetical protein